MRFRKMIIEMPSNRSMRIKNWRLQRGCVILAVTTGTKRGDSHGLFFTGALNGHVCVKRR